jgi:hypothetical protein
MLKQSTSKKHEVKDEENIASQPSKGKESFKRTKKERHHEAILGTPKKRYEMYFSWALLFM